MMKSVKPGRLGIGVIGSGKVGAVLGSALRAAEHQIVGVHAVSEASKERAEMLLPGVPVLEIPEILRRAELVLLAVPDDALADLVAGLAAAGHWQAGQLVIHTAGRYGTNVLAPATQAGAIALAIHPAMTFTGMSMDLERLTDCAFGVTASNMVLPIAQALVVEMGGEPVVISEENRPIYHTALAHASNHLVTIAGQSAGLLASIGIDQPERVLSSLMRASLENALASGEGALTGPVARGDVQTVLEHKHALNAQHIAQDTREGYVAMSRATALRANARGLINDRQLAALLTALDSAS
ncbi:oxidoreductase [Arthrobacter sp. MYb227]|uniref:Rossmann-like and DUF2520 domain-containing protein n=1 Tax=Arthrobacter sp. MYb227 TaxID=1848601 RepID=UPI000CFDAA42|nr:DUF2520 domain-containing protein [Arthrobacter sp. MYb227]PQZ90195.1 oxidoreductase [Arthrobacter sp. MYb227]